MKKERVTVVHVWRTTANQSKLTDLSSRHSTRWWLWKPVFIVLLPF